MAGEMLKQVPENLRDKVAWSQEVCSDCANCPIVHHTVSGEVIITNDRNLHAPAVILTEEQWEDLKDHIRSGRIE